MSFSLDVVSLTGATAGTTGTVSWANLAQSVGYGIPEAGPPHLALLNESPCGLQLQFSTGEQMSLPAGGWQTITLNPTCTNFTYTVLYVLNASPIVASLLGTWYAPGELVPDAPILGNSPIGATVATAPIANELQGIGQSFGLTEKDRGLPFANPGPALIPALAGQGLHLQNGNGTEAFSIDGVSSDSTVWANLTVDGAAHVVGAVTMDAAATVGTTLGVTGATTLSSTVHAVGAVTMDAAASVGTTLGVTGATTLSSTVHAVGAVTMDAAASVGGGLVVTGGVVMSSVITTYHGETTQAGGVPAIVAIAQNTSITTTVQTAIVTYTTPNDGANHSMRVNAWCDVNNSVSGNNIALQVVYSDPRSGLTTITPFSTATSTASQSFNAVASITNGIYAMYPYVIYCKPNSTVTIQYRDPTNTPADHVSAFIERIS